MSAPECDLLALVCERVERQEQALADLRDKLQALTLVLIGTGVTPLAALEREEQRVRELNALEAAYRASESGAGADGG